MITIISSKGDSLNSAFEERFGRAPWFCVYEKESQKAEFIKNEFAESMGGAGTKTAEKMLQLKADKVISGHFGPKAYDLLKELKIQMVTLQDEDITIEEIIKRFKN